jgi:hypothetical protein
MSNDSTNADLNPSTSDDFASFDLFSDDDRGGAAVAAADTTAPADPATAAPASTETPAADDGAAAAAETGTSTDPVRTEGEPKPEGDAAASATQAARDPDARQRDGILGELREERAQRRQIEQQAATERQAFMTQMAEMQQFMQRFVQQPQAAQAQQPKTEAPPVDFALLTPQQQQQYLAERDQRIEQTLMARINGVQQQATGAVRMQNFQASETRAVEQYGQENIGRVKEWVNSLGQEAGVYYTGQPDPMGAAIADYQKALALKVYGPDPRAFAQTMQQRLEADLTPKIRAQVMEELRQGKPTPAAPPTLGNQTRGGGKSAADLGLVSFGEDVSSFLND